MSGFPRWVRWLLVALVVLLLLPIIGWVTARSLVITDQCRPGDEMVVLAGAGAYPERAGRAAELFHLGFAPRILLTDDGLKGAYSLEEQRNLQLVEWAREVLLERGVPEGRIEILAPTVSGTIDEARVVRSHLARSGAGSIVLVTSPHHTRRTLRTFRTELGEEVSVAICPVAPEPSIRRDALWWATPGGWRRIALEYVKLGYYRIRFG